MQSCDTDFFTDDVVDILLKIAPSHEVRVLHVLAIKMFMFLSSMFLIIFI
jgi:hypothetical protein